MKIVKPTALTDGSDQELINKSISQGDVISDGTHDRIIAGFQKDGFGDKSFGFKVSQEGYDVKTAEDDQLIMSSAFNMFKIVAKGTTTIPSFTAGTSQTNYSSVTVAHNLGYTPIVQVYARGYIVNGSFSLVSSAYAPLPISVSDVLPANYYFPDTAGTPVYRQIGLVFAVDSTNLYIQAGTLTTQSALTMAEIPVTYFLLRETAT